MNSTINNNNDNSNNIIINNNYLFYKIWHNKVILKEIFRHLKLFNKNFKKSYSTKKQYLDDIYRGYVLDLTINFRDKVYCGEISTSVSKLTIGGRYKQTSLDSQFGNSIEIGTIPSSVKYLVLGERFTQPLKSGYIPSSVTDLVISSKYGQPLVCGIIPNSIINLQIYCDFYLEYFDTAFERDYNNISILPNIIPSSVLNLTYGSNQTLLSNSIPNSVTTLSLCRSFNQPLTNIIPTSIKTLRIGGNFNIPIQPNDIPTGVVNLNLKGQFNSKITPGLLPTSISKLKLGNKFNSKIEINSIPNVKTLIFGSDFNLQLNKEAIPMVKEIIFGDSFNKPLTKSLPSSLEILKFGHSFNQYIDIDTLPKTLDTLIFGYSFCQFLSKCQIPFSVKTLIFGSTFNCPSTVLPPFVETLCFIQMPYDEVIKPGYIPKTVKTLSLGSNKIKSNSIPTSVSTLSFSIGGFVKLEDTKNIIPNSVTDLTIKEYYAYCTPDTGCAINIPSSVKKLNIHLLRFVPPLDKLLPIYLETLIINASSHLIIRSIPSISTLKSITFGDFFLQKLLPGYIPDSVESLTFINQKMLLKNYISSDALPKSLIQLKVSTIQIDIDTLKPIIK